MKVTNKNAPVITSVIHYLNKPFHDTYRGGVNLNSYTSSVHNGIVAVGRDGTNINDTMLMSAFRYAVVPDLPDARSIGGAVVFDIDEDYARLSVTVVTPNSNLGLMRKFTTASGVNRTLREIVGRVLLAHVSVIEDYAEELSGEMSIKVTKISECQKSDLQILDDDRYLINGETIVKHLIVVKYTPSNLEQWLRDCHDRLMRKYPSSNR